MASSRLHRSLRLRDSIVIESNAHCLRVPQHTASAEDIMFIKILDCIGALSCIRADQKKKNSNCANREEGQAEVLLSYKHRVFWQAVREVADQEAALEDVPAKKKEKETTSALDFMLDCFPDDSKRSDGRLWLSLPLAVSLPSSSRLEDIHTLLVANPAVVKAPADDTNQLNSRHLAALMKNPWIEIIQRLQVCDPGFGLSKDRFRNTPLRLAGRYLDARDVNRIDYATYTMHYVRNSIKSVGHIMTVGQFIT